MSVIFGDKDYEISNLIIAYITVHYGAIFHVGFNKMCLYVSREARKAVSFILTGMFNTGHNMINRNCT